jgi:hypothetical protein
MWQSYLSNLTSTNATPNPMRDHDSLLVSSRPFILAWLAYSFVILLGAWYLLFPSRMAERMDFRQLYASGYLARTEPENLYDFDRQKFVQDEYVSHAVGLLPFIRPAYEALLFVPLSRLSYRAAYFCFLCLNLLLLIPCFYLCPEALCKPGTVAQPRPGLQLFAFFPVTIALLQGQDSILMLLGLCLVFRSLKAKGYFLAGALLALLIFKLQIVIPIMLFLAVRYGLTFFAGFAALSLLASGASVALAGWQTLLSFARVLFLTGSVSLSSTVPSGSFGVVSLAMPNLRGLIFAATNWFVTGKVTFALILVLSIYVALRTMRLLVARGANLDISFSVAVASAILVSYYLHIQDLSLMLIPLGLMASSQNALISRAAILIYFAPPFLVMLGHDWLFLLSLPVIMFLYGIYESQAVMRPLAIELLLARI